MNRILMIVLAACHCLPAAAAEDIARHPLTAGRPARFTDHCSPGPAPLLLPSFMYR